MIDFDKWEEIWITISKHKLRTALTAFGVFWGIFMLVVLLGAGNGLRNGVMQNFDMAKNAVFVWTQTTSIPFAGFQGGREISLTNEDFEALKRVKQIKYVAPRTPLSGRFGQQQVRIERKNKSVSFRIMGDYPQYLEIKPILIESGRFLNEIDIAKKRKVVILGRRVRDGLFEEHESAVGQYITIGEVPFKVIGVAGTKLTNEDAMDDLQAVYIPNTTLQQTFNRPNDIGWFGFVPEEGTSGLELEEIVKDVFRDRHKIHPDDDQALGSFNLEAEFNELQGIFSGIAAFSWLVAIGTILAGMIGVGNIMMIIVKERTKEIGIRKSLGAKPWSIISMIVHESVVITAVAGYMGLLLGVVLVEGVAYALKEFDFQSEFFANPEINFQVAISAISVLLLSGIIAGLIPGIIAAKLHPVLALRDD